MPIVPGCLVCWGDPWRDSGGVVGTQAEKEALEAEVSRCEEAVREAEGAVQRQRAETSALTAGIAGAEKVGCTMHHSSGCRPEAKYFRRSADTFVSCTLMLARR